MKVSIIVPAFNEAGSVRETVDALAREVEGAEILVVDDGSTDGTGEKLAGSAAKVIRHARNRGYGASLKTGIRRASGDVVVFCDADGQHSPADVKRLLGAIEDGAHMAVGKRPKKGSGSPGWRGPGKWFLGKLANYLAREKIPDLNCGLRALHRELALDLLGICPNGFSMSSTLTLAALADGHEVRWLDIEVHPRAPKSSSSVTVKTGFDTILLIMRLSLLFEPLRVFLPLSILFILGGFGWGLPYLLQWKGISIGALLLIITGVLTFFFGMLADQATLLRRRKR